MTEHAIPGFLCHYYEATDGPFRNLSDLPLVDAEEILQRIRQTDSSRFASRRPADYMVVRRQLEELVRQQFIAKGGRPRRNHPHYLILGACPWVLDWYPDGRELRIPLAVFGAEIISFTYGDTFPAMRYPDGKPYRGQVYTLAELPVLIETFGLPQDWNATGEHGPDRYIEAQVWADEPLRPYTIA
jgi:hypothetical protein